LEEFNDQRTRLAQRAAELESLKNDLELQRHALQEDTQSFAQQGEELQQQVEQQQQLQEQLRQTETELADQTAELKTRQAECEQQRTHLEQQIQKQAAQETELKKTHDDLETERDRLRQITQKYEQQQQNELQALQQQCKQFKSQQAEWVAAVEDVTRYKDRLSTKREKLFVIQSQIDERDDELNQKQARLEEKSDELIQVKQLIESTRMQLENERADLKMRKQENECAELAMQAQRTEIADYRNRVSAHVEQLANDRRELERMLVSMTEQKMTQTAELENTWQSINKRQHEIDQQHASPARSRSSLQTEADDVQQNQQAAESHRNEPDPPQQKLESQSTEANQEIETS